ncbi:unnamed protein product [Vitrella brassicaformis CCMP3155]|uniref:Uncharacterized protein n=1 Tax=Vitrella brassicaformis (strain CCMP3155) TaxID=1169540 RepID=A0A0G4GI33_VITBC|nr:unnamed protein product [Vitrella brassicaformis CCMP3155]|eukprot:CEM29394.1 unnamed protein product [Vitrella brassicaformis CCMP3155]
MPNGTLEPLESIEEVELPEDEFDCDELRGILMKGGCRSLKCLEFRVPQQARSHDPDEAARPHWYPLMLHILQELDGLRSQLPARKITAPNCTIDLTFPADGISIELGPAHALIARAITLIKWEPTTPRPWEDTDGQHSGTTDPAAFADMHRFPHVKELQIKSGSIDLSQHPPTSPVWSALQLLPQDAFPEGMLLTAEGPVGCEAARQLAFTGRLAGKVASLALCSLSSGDSSMAAEGDVVGVLEAMGSGEQLQEACLSAIDGEVLRHRLDESADWIPAIQHLDVGSIYLGLSPSVLQALREYPTTDYVLNASKAKRTIDGL